MNKQGGSKMRVVDVVADIFNKLKNGVLEPYELVDITYVKEGPQRFLRIFIDKEGGITTEDCKTVSQALDEFLDKGDFIKDAYFLEVSSPGIERPLKKIEDFVRFAGKDAEIKLFTPINGLKLLNGKIVKAEKNTVYMNLADGGEDVEIPFEKISQAKLSFKFDF